ncbi:TRAP transporter permease [Salinadaptatus halalkaliphilus]|uniref:TRAP transporter permease n=1 Tax=Salinadaptatus halalkaliphilus TaxID=2419781 RepID=A0A4S3TIQ7_9EURY|nr:TRAP transporter fused permease subunit [Salinadaptatus halalkaliphilus]THE63846.1 TRAP transporter permease [Salinadaptatus halalkaliphilus]
MGTNDDTNSTDETTATEGDEPAVPDSNGDGVLDDEPPLSISDGLRGRFETAVILGSIPLWLIVFWYSYTQMMPRARYGTLFLGGVLLLYILLELPDDLEDGNRLEAGMLVVSAGVILAATVYLFTYYQWAIIDRAGHAYGYEIGLALAFVFVMIYLTWRSFGMTFLVVVIAGILYGLGGSYIPGTLGHGGLSPERTLRILAVSGDGFYGFLTQLVAAWIALFLLYAGLLKAYGAFDLILRMAVRSAKYVDSGIAQTAVLASAVIGSVNGSQTANAGMTGSFTIPLMKKSGVKPATAGGIESVASTAGQVLPPVMGAGAFIMASLISGITYVDVIIAGLIPAFILVVSIVVAVHYAAAPQIDDPEMGGMFDDKLETQQLVLEGIKYGVPLLVLVYLLGYLQTTVMTAAFWTAISMMVFGITIPIVEALLDGGDVGGAAVYTGKQTIEGFRQGVIVVAPITIILAAINGVVDLLMATGVPTAISLTLMDLSGGVMLIAVILAMIICIILGLGMPTTAAYTVVALLVAPTLINQFFVPELASHYFVFYAAILAGLTPPIATCVAVATGIAGSDFWRTCYEAIKISAPLFILPFAFVYHPELVGGEFTSEALIAGGIALLAAIIIIHGINYRFTFGRTQTYGLRVGFIVSGIVAMVYWEQLIQLAALGLAVSLYVVQVAIGKPDPLALVRGAVSGFNGRRGQR